MLVKLSNELIRTAVVGLDAVLRTRLVTDVANALDAALWDGTGTSNTIKGILRQTGIATGTLDLTDPDSLIDGLAVAQGNKVTPTHWVMTVGIFAKIRKVKVGTTDARYVIDPNTIQNGTDFRLLGLPVIVTDNISRGRPDEGPRRPGRLLQGGRGPRRQRRGQDPRPDLGRLRQHRYPRRVPLGHRTVAGQGRHLADRGVSRGRGRSR